MRAPEVTMQESTPGGPRASRWSAPFVPIVLGGALLGAALVVALGLGGGVFESGPSEADLQAAYRDGLQAGGEAGLATVGAQRRAERESEASRTATRVLRDDVVHASLGPQRVPVGDTGESDAAVICGQTRCFDAGSGLSVHVVTVQGWFDPGRVDLTAPILRTAAIAGNLEAPYAQTVSQRSAAFWWAQMLDRFQRGNATDQAGARVRCDETQCTDVASGVLVSLIRVQGWFDPTLSGNFTPGRRNGVRANDAGVERVEIFGMDGPVFEAPTTGNP